MAKLGDVGEQDGEFGGRGPLVNVKRRKRTPELIRERIRKHVDNPPTTEGVRPLNPGFFFMQRVRANAAR